jgi:hypothetical protein
MQIIEQFTEGKKSQKTNEDAIIATNDFAAIIDGATTKSGTRILRNCSNGKYSATLIMEVIKELPEDASCDFFCKNATEKIKNIYLKHGIYEHVKNHAVERLTSSVVVYSLHRNEIWMIGDCQAYVNGETYRYPKPTDIYLAERRSAFIHEQLLKGNNPIDFTIHDSGREYILPELVDSCSLQNPEKPEINSFSVVDGFDINMSLINIIKLKNNVEEIILASDGYPVLYPTLKETECKLQEILKIDPLCIDNYKATKSKMKGTKSFDDRSYIRIKR